jgi:RNA-directed DNA polymerase
VGDDSGPAGNGKNVTDWCRTNRHQPIPAQQARLSAAMRGHYAYYGITGNMRCLNRFAHQVKRIWRKWLSRRDRQSDFSWNRLGDLLTRHPLPPPKIVHRYAVPRESQA